MARTAGRRRCRLVGALRVNTPLGTVEAAGGWVETTVTTLRRPAATPADALSVVVKRFALPGFDIVGALRDEVAAIRRGLGGDFKDEGALAVSFLGEERRGARFSFSVGQDRVTQALAGGVCPFGAFSVTLSALSSSFDRRLSELLAVAASFSPSR